MDHDTALYEQLSALSVIDQATLDEVYQLSKDEGTSLADSLVARDLLSDDNLGKLEAEIWGMRYVNLAEVPIDPLVTQLIPVEFAKTNLVTAISQSQAGYLVAVNDPTNQKLLDNLRIRFDRPVTFVYATKKSLSSSHKIYATSPDQVFGDLLHKYAANLQTLGDSSVVELVDKLLTHGHEQAASDIHIEPSEKVSTVRFRIDGIMHDILTLPLDLHTRIVTRIKVMADLRTDDQLSAQDGKLTFMAGSEKVDVRVSTVPVVEGENIVMRLLSASTRQFSLLDLGFSQEASQILLEAKNKPNGMILATGPTGSGKTTTLYAILKLLNSRDVKIMTIEDPVEYDIEGISQVQVNHATNLTFSEGLKSLVRQDPDVILVGEIRDADTASIAVNAAMTGHLVLSSLHTNDAATTIPRLLDLGVEPFLIASTINVVVAQRLVRKLCLQCRVSLEVDAKTLSKSMNLDHLKKHFGDNKVIRLYSGKGCAACSQTGYSGRLGIFELMPITEKIKQAIINKETADNISSIAIKEGMQTMFEDGLAKVKSGQTTIEELLRVTKE